MSIENHPPYLLIKLFHDFTMDKLGLHYFLFLFVEDKERKALLLLPYMLKFYGDKLDEKYNVLREYYGGFCEIHDNSCDMEIIKIIKEITKLKKNF